MNRLAATSAAALCLYLAAMGPSLAAPGAGCAAPQSHLFDFWIGRWSVYDVLNKSPGKSVIESIYNGCGIHESWTEESLVGGSISAFNPADGQWRQLWVDSSGGMREFIGGSDAPGRMVLVARYPSSKLPGKTVMDRITYTARADGTVRQYSDASVDGGVTWKPLYDNIYTRER